MQLSAARLARMRRSPAWDGARFRNQLPSPVLHGSGLDVARRFLFERAGRTPPAPLPTVAPERAVLAGPADPDLRVTWLGHSTLLVEIEGRRLLTDPVWAERASLVAYAGPKRFQPVPVPIDALPALDAVVLSHDHYDHLDRGAVEALAAKGARFVAPLGVGERLERWGIAPERVTELDWDEATDVVPGVTLRALPSRHFSGRGPFDRNLTLWASYALEGRSRRVYFGGDGGMDEATFARIGREHGPFDLTMLEIGAFDPAWGSIHLGPENALAAHALLRGRVLLPIHWGTFDLGLHAWDAPPEELLAFARGRDVTLAMPRIGGTFRPDAPPAVEPWWREAREPVAAGAPEPVAVASDA